MDPLRPQVLFGGEHFNLLLKNPLTFASLMGAMYSVLTLVQNELRQPTTRHVSEQPDRSDMFATKGACSGLEDQDIELLVTTVFNNVLGQPSDLADFTDPIDPIDPADVNDALVPALNSLSEAPLVETLTVCGTVYEKVSLNVDKNSCCLYTSKADSSSTLAMTEFDRYSLIKAKVDKRYLIVAGYLLVPDIYTDIKTVEVLNQLQSEKNFQIFRLYSVWLSACNKLYYIVEDHVNPKGLMKKRAAA